MQMIHQVEHWTRELAYSARGEVLCTMPNVATILKYDENLKNIVFNEMRQSIDIIGPVPWRKKEGVWNSTDFPCFELYLEKQYGIYAPKKCKDALYAVLSSKMKYHPIKTYLESLQWDGKERLGGLLVDYLGAEDNEYVRAVTQKTFTAAVARIYQPGIKFDTILVLCGEQGIGKSTLFAKMGRDWYSDSMTIADMKDKSAAEKLQGIWMMELSELAGIKKIDVEIVKSFLSRMDDQYRAPYETHVASHPRSSILVGTTNSTNGFLRDITGNRRFWPVKVTGNGEKRVWDLTSEEIGQLWAEALHLYLSDERLYLEPELEREAGNFQRDALETDPRLGLVQEYLDVGQKTKICLMELWCECLGKDRSDMKRRDAFELEGILHQLGNWEIYKGNTTGKMRLPNYGVQKTFVKVFEEEREGEKNELGASVGRRNNPECDKTSST